MNDCNAEAYMPEQYRGDNDKQRKFIEDAYKDGRADRIERALLAVATARGIFS